MKTGIYIRVEHEGKFQTAEITEITDKEIDFFFQSKERPELLRYIKWFINYIKEIQA